MPSPSRVNAPAGKAGRPRLLPPVFVLAGGASGQDAASNAAASKLLVAAFSGISGTLISGGTTSGIAGIAGEVAAAHAGIAALGYLPRALPVGAKRDRRYAGFRTTRADDFSVAECLAYWEDLVEAGIPPGAVKLLGWGGGPIAALEYRVAVALGARVGLVAGSGRAADAMARGRARSRPANLQVLGCDAAAVRAFLTSR